MKSRRLAFVCRVALLALTCLQAPAGERLLAMAADPASASLIGTSWTAEDIGGQGVVDQVQSTLTFESEGQASGSAGCNRYLAPIQLSGASLRFGMASTTRRACPPTVMGQERRFLAALDAARTYRQDGSTLWLLDEAGHTLLRLTQRATATERGASPEASPVTAPLTAYAFDCANDQGFVLRMVDSDTIDLILPDRTRRLTQQTSASGVRYSDGEITVWNKGREATLELADQTYECTENRARSVREDARARGVEVWGVGQEPGWVLEVLSDQLVFTSNYGTERVVVPRQSTTVNPAHTATVYTASTAAHRLRVRVQERACTDSMSGERYDVRVAVELDGRDFQGCGVQFR